MPGNLDKHERKRSRKKAQLTSSNLINIFNSLERQGRARLGNQPRSLRIHPNIQVAPRSILIRQVPESSTGPLAVLDRELLPADSNRVPRVDVLIVRQTDIASSLEGWRNDPGVVQVKRDADVACGSVYTCRVSTVSRSRGSFKRFALRIPKLGCQITSQRSERDVPS